MLVIWVIKTLVLTVGTIWRAGIINGDMISTQIQRMTEGKLKVVTERRKHLNFEMKQKQCQKERGIPIAELMSEETIGKQKLYGKEAIWVMKEEIMLKCMR